MTAPPVRLLLLEDNRTDAELLQAALAELAPGDFAITRVERLADALARIRAEPFDVLLSDLSLPDSTGSATVQAIAARAPALPLVVLTGMKADDLGRAAIQHGAQDYLVKGESGGALMVRTLRYAIERKRLEIGLRAANEALAGRVAERTAELDAANAVLLANAAGYRQLFDANPHPMYMFDPETLRFITVNDVAVAGWSREEFLAMTIADIRPAGEKQLLRDHIARVQQEDIREAGFWKHRKKDGTLIEVEISSHAIDFGGRRARVVLAHDITERRRAEEALRESEARFRSLTEMSSDFYWESDVEHRFTVHIASSKSSQAWVSQRGAQIGQRRWEIPHLSPNEAGWQAHRAVLDAHQPFRDFVFSRRGADGTERYFAVSGDPVFDASGAFKGYRGVGSDITERKRAEQALLESEARFRSLTEMSSDFYWETDAEHRFTQGNSAANLSVQSVWRTQIGKRRWETPYLSPDEASWQAHRAELEAHRPFREFELSRLGTDGTEHHLSVSGDPVLDASGAFKGYRGVGSDITERKRAEQALLDSGRLLRESQSIAGLGSYVLDIPTGRWSSSAVLDDIFGIDDNCERSVAGWLSLIHPDWQERMSHYFTDEVLGKHVRFDREYRIIRKTDGEARWVYGLGELEFDAQGQPRRMIGTISDITERKQSERALRAAEEQFRGLVEQSIAGTYIIQDGKFAYVNPRFAEIFGYGSADEMIGRDALAMVAEKDRDRVAGNMRRRIEGEVASISYDFVGVRKDGSMIEVGVHGAYATHLGRPAVIGMMQDISEKKRAEEQIRRYVAQLEKAFMSTVGVATTLSEMRDPYTAGHERRVAEIAVAIGAELGFDVRGQEGLRVAGYLHDIGKITIPSEILSKPGRLSPLEFKLIQGHSQASYDVLKDVEFPWPVADVALQHHERIDGSGYPQGLRGEAILLEARIMAVADVVEAMSSHRPYRAGLGIEKALAEIERGRGTAYDAVVADACLKLFRDGGYAIPA